MANSTSHAALPYPIKNARFTLLVPYLDADGDPTDPTTPDTEFSGDAGAFADCAEEVSTISGSNGTGYITLTGAETNYSMLALAAKVASGPKNTLATLYPRNLASIGTGTLSAGSAGGGTLGTILAYDVTNCFIMTTGGTGGGGTGGANNQARRIATYTPSTGAFTVTPNWETTPDNTTTYSLLLPEGVTLGMLRTLNPATAGRTLLVGTSGQADANVTQLLGTNWLTPATAGTPDVNVKLAGGTAWGSGAVTAASIAASALNGKGDWLLASSYTSPPSAATIATTLLTDLTSSSDFNTVGSFGKLIKDNLDTTVSSRGTSTLTQTQVTGGAYALNSSSFAFNSALDFTTTQKTSLNAATPSVTVSDKTGFSLTQAFPANFADLAITSSTGRVTVGANADKTGYSLSQTFPSNFASLVISAGGVVSADAVSLSGDATAADNAESFFDGTGYAGTNNVIPTVTLVNTLTTYTGNTPQTGDAYAIVNSGTFGNAAIKGYVDDIGTAGAGLTAIPWNAAWDVEVQSEVQDAIEVNNLDHLVKVAVDTDFPTTVHLDSVIGYLADNGTTATFDRTTDALEAIRDRGDVAWTTGTGTSTLTAGDVSTAVWNAATASYGTAGTYGALVEANLDAAISSRSTYDGSDTSGTTTLLERVTATRAGYWDNLSAGAVALASGVTVTTNNDKTGYSLTVTPPTAAQVTTSVWSTLLSGSDFNTSGSIGKLLKDDVDTTISSRQATVSFPTNFSSLGINASGHVSRVTLADTTTTVTNAVTVGDVTLATIQPNYAPAKAGDAMTLTTGERGSIADAFLDRANGIETGITPRQAIRAMAAMLGGEISGVTAENGTVTVTIKAIGNNTVTRITMDTDELGNRSSITMS